MRTAVAGGVFFACAVVDVILFIAARGLADAIGGALDGSGMAYLGGIASGAMSAAVCVVISFAFLAIGVETGVAGFERAFALCALTCTVGDDAAIAVFAAVGDGVSFAGLAIDVIAAVTGSDDTGLVLAGRCTVVDGAGIAV